MKIIILNYALHEFKRNPHLKMQEQKHLEANRTIAHAKALQRALNPTQDTVKTPLGNLRVAVNPGSKDILGDVEKQKTILETQKAARAGRVVG